MRTETEKRYYRKIGRILTPTVDLQSFTCMEEEREQLEKPYKLQKSPLSQTFCRVDRKVY